MYSICVILAAAASAADSDNGSTDDSVDLRCGAYCLYVSLRALEIPIESYEQIEADLGPPSPAGYSMAQLSEVAKKHGAETLGVDTTFENLRRRPQPFACIAHINGNHFVNFAEVEDRQAWVIDPPREYSVPLDTLRTQWEGKALLISATPLLAEDELPRPFPWNVVLIVVVSSLAAWTLWVVFRRRFARG